MCEKMITPGAHRSPRLTRRKAFVFKLISLLLGTALAFAAAESLVRLKGIQPWVVTDLQIQVRPGERFFTPHPTRGYTQLPGAFEVGLADGYTFHVTHLPSGLRITHPLATYDYARPKPEIWIMGCSFTHGWSLNDQETYAWVLQEHLPDYEVVNYGVEGYGTLHALLQLREALATQPPPRVVIYAYASLHDERNTFVRHRRKYLTPWNRLGPLIQPYARLTHDRQLRYAFAQVEYTEWPLMRFSAFIHFLEMMYNEIEARWARSHEVSKRLLLEMAELAKQYHYTFVVAAIAEDAHTGEMLTFARDQGLKTVDIAVDSRRSEYTNQPHDSHPSPLANAHYAEQLERFLRTEALPDQDMLDRERR
jgi:hypothetical protein